MKIWMKSVVITNSSKVAVMLLPGLKHNEEERIKIVYNFGIR
jgi:hypothetical protein